jgi:hypothetical protein
LGTSNIERQTSNIEGKKSLLTNPNSLILFLSQTEEGTTEGTEEKADRPASSFASLSDLCAFAVNSWEHRTSKPKHRTSKERYRSSPRTSPRPPRLGVSFLTNPNSLILFLSQTEEGTTDGSTEGTKKRKQTGPRLPSRPSATFVPLR